MTLLTPSALTSRRSSRKTKGSQQSARFVDEAYLTSLISPDSPDSTGVRIKYLAELGTEFNTGTIECVDPRAYAAKFKVHNADNPSYHTTMSSDNYHERERLS